MGLKNAKKKGSRNEHRSMKLYEAKGYRCTRAAGSLGEWDFIALGTRPEHFTVVLVQVKSNAWPGLVEMQRLTEFPCHGNVQKIVHRWDDRARAPRIAVFSVKEQRWTR